MNQNNKHKVRKQKIHLYCDIILVSLAWAALAIMVVWVLAATGWYLLALLLKC